MTKFSGLFPWNRKIKWTTRIVHTFLLLVISSRSCAQATRETSQIISITPKPHGSAKSFPWGSPADIQTQDLKVLWSYAMMRPGMSDGVGKILHRTAHVGLRGVYHVVGQKLKSFKIITHSCRHEGREYGTYPDNCRHNYRCEKRSKQMELSTKSRSIILSYESSEENQHNPGTRTVAK